MSGRSSYTLKAKGKPFKSTSVKKKDSSLSNRFKKITERAQKIRKAHPKMAWANCIRQAARELKR